MNETHLTSGELWAALFFVRVVIGLFLLALTLVAASYAHERVSIWRERAREKRDFKAFRAAIDRHVKGEEERSS